VPPAAPACPAKVIFVATPVYPKTPIPAAEVDVVADAAVAAPPPVVPAVPPVQLINVLLVNVLPP
jgi:hypothetical protein